ncbi:MAG: hypothetical protein ACXVLT_00450 [Flavisolibacter sp.]
MRIAILLVLAYASCTLPEEKKAKEISEKQDTTVIESNDANTAALDTSSMQLRTAPKLHLPSGIYQASLPLNKKVEQTVAFNSDLTYQLEEKYSTGDKDTVVISQGTWTPSDGYIWLYKDQIVSGRYKWKRDTLQYYSPLVKKSFSMHSLNDAMQNKALKSKVSEGVVFFGTGNEPFWNVELDNKDSLSFRLAEMDHPLRLKIDTSVTKENTVQYSAHSDSTKILVTIFPHFCSDGMSDFVYRNKVKVQYNQQVYDGCGLLFRR